MLIEIVVAGVVLVTIAFIFVLGAPPVSSTKREADAVVALLRPLAPTEVTDLGAGWGALVVRLAHDFPDARITGYELSPLPWLVAKIRCVGKKNVHIAWQDFRRAPLRGALVCYLARGPAQRVSALLPPGAYLVSVCFLLRDRKPIRTLRATGLGGEVALYQA